jgi:glycosyltransferase involved in cell wall biosynthesis
VDPALITAVIPTYRRPALLARAIRSVLVQTEIRLEVFVCDNASGDETGDVVEALAAGDPRVRYHVQPRNLGAFANFRSGLEAVRTPWFGFLSDDDVLLPSFYATARAALEAAPEGAFFCGQTVVWDPRDGGHRVSPRRGWVPGLHAAGTHAAEMAAALFTWTSCLFPAELGRSAWPPLEGAFGDLAFLVRAAARAPFVVALEPCSVFTSWSGGAFAGTPPAALREGYAGIRALLAGDPALSEVQGREVLRRLEEVERGVLEARLKAAFASGDWAAFDAVAAAFDGRWRLTAGKRLRLALGRRRARFPRLVAAVRRRLLRAAARRRSREGRDPVFDVDELVRRYAGPGGSAA